MLIMKKYCQDGNIGGARFVIMQIFKNNYPPTKNINFDCYKISYSLLYSEMLEYMKEKKMSADEKVFNNLIEAHINAK